MIPAMSTIARIGLAVVALAVSAWFGLGFYQAHHTQRASALIVGATHLTRSQVREAKSELDAAGTLNPDRAVNVLRGQLAADQGRDRTAIGILSSVTAREPLNLMAWAQLGFAAAKAGDRALVAVAGRHIAILIPRVK